MHYAFLLHIDPPLLHWCEHLQEVLAIHDECNEDHEVHPKGVLRLQATPLRLLRAPRRPHLGLRQTRPPANRRPAQSYRGLHFLLEDVPDCGLQPAVGEGMMLNASQCAGRLRNFFERDIIGEDGQNVLRYNPALETPVKKGFNNRDLVEVFQNQRCLPLVEVLPKELKGGGNRRRV